MNIDILNPLWVFDILELSLLNEVLYLHFSVGTENKVVWKNMASVNLPQRVNQKKSDTGYQVSVTVSRT